MYQIELKLSDKSRALLEKMPGLVMPALKVGMQESMFLAEATAKGKYLSGLALHHRSGRLMRSIATRVNISKDKVSGTIGSNVVYARIHELGGVILPRKGKSLKFQIPGVGWRQVQRVNMPARPYLRPSIMSNLYQIGEILSRRIEESFETV